MAVKVLTNCRSCDINKTSDIDDCNLIDFKDSMISKECSICGKNSVVIVKVEDSKVEDLKPEEKPYKESKLISLVPEIPENRFTYALVIALIMAFILIVFYLLGNPNWL